MSIISLVIDIGDGLFDSVTFKVGNFYYRSVGKPIDRLPGSPGVRVNYRYGKTNRYIEISASLSAICLQQRFAIASGGAECGL